MKSFRAFNNEKEKQSNKKILKDQESQAKDIVSYD